MSIQVSGIHKSFGRFQALRDVSLDIQTGEFLALLGPSGSGKTTLLRITAGLEQPDGGSIHFFGEDATGTHVRDRGIGFVFQHFALFRHMTVLDNVAFGLRVKPRAQRPAESEIVAQSMELLRLVHLEQLAGRFPAQLSGGQRQRVALARALATRPRVLLLDEPFGALDARVRLDLRRWLRGLHDALGVTSIIVTHDQDEALEIADRVLIMHDGTVEQLGTPTEVHDHPATPFAMEFLGDVTMLEGRVEGGEIVCGPLRLQGVSLRQGTPVRLAVRSFDVKFWHDPAGPATVQRMRVLGDRAWVDAALEDGTVLHGRFPRRSSLLHGVELGARVQIGVTTAHYYPADGQPAGCWQAADPT
jgi:sulfate transport system ATP-binding protein